MLSSRVLLRKWYMICGNQHSLNFIIRKNIGSKITILFRKRFWRNFVCCMSFADRKIEKSVNCAIAGISSGTGLEMSHNTLKKQK